MTEYVDKPKGRNWKSFLKPLAIVALLVAVGWYFSQGEPSYPDVGAGESVFELQLTPL